MTMQHLPLATEMFMHGKQDRAGRLLTTEERMLAQPDHAYWETKATAAASILPASAAQRAAIDATIPDAWMEAQTWLMLYQLYDRMTRTLAVTPDIDGAQLAKIGMGQAPVPTVSKTARLRGEVL
jgi:hypothetical protein